MVGRKGDGGGSAQLKCGHAFASWGPCVAFAGSPPLRFARHGAREQNYRKPEQGMEHCCFYVL